MSSKVSTEDLRLAAAWLESNEGEDGEAEACARVAAWIDAEIERRRLSQVAREVSKQIGRSVSAAQVRDKLKFAAA